MKDRYEILKIDVVVFNDGEEGETVPFESLENDNNTNMETTRI